ncbi:MAG: histidinol dehydrogenase [Coriobacteriales bacterium]|nr:histidinol dehydrogenase [Coriobacteriales bacterium]
MLKRIILAANEEFDTAMLGRKGVLDPDVVTSAAAIVGEVRKRGDEALREFCRRFDRVEIDDFRVPESSIEAAFEQLDDELLESLEYAADNIWDFHSRQLTESWFNPRQDGAFLGSKVTPLDSVGIYVPGGRAQYPSTVLMNAIPAKVAGVERVIMCTPPQKDGGIDPCTLAAARIAGVDEIYRVGGAQAIAALAYGTESIPAVDKITGPGNAYVAAAKKIVSGDVGIDMIAGPSEVCVLADHSADPRLVAIDLMAQAEHDPQASCYLICGSEDFVDKVEANIEDFLAQTTREEITRTSLSTKGLAVVVPSLSQAFDVANVIAPEHLELQIANPLEYLHLVRHAGAIFMGEFTPESVGDYVAGPNHTLPTGGSARFSSPLSVEDFIKRSSVISYSPTALALDAKAIMRIARQEGLWAHARAVEVRMDDMQGLAEFIDTLVEQEAHGHHHHHHDGCGCGCDHD